MNTVKSESKKQHMSKKCLIIKVPQFLPYLHETWSKLLAHELLILTKFHEDRPKTVELLLIQFWELCCFFTQTLQESSRFLKQVKIESKNMGRNGVILVYDP